MARLASLARTLPKLGLANVATVALYRLALKSGVAELLTPDTPAARGVLLAGHHLPPASPSADVDALRQRGEAIKAGVLSWFSAHGLKAGAPPDWFVNPFNGVRASGTGQHWSRLPDFDPGLGDIKTVWEPSRFDWFCDLARAARATGDRTFLDTANAWADDWIAANPPYRGHNWKCGQEASLRLLAVLHGCWLSGDIQTPTDSLVSFAQVHLARIRPSMAYAVAQDNNHGTSEAVALWVGGRFLERHGSARTRARGASYAKLGRSCLIERIMRLVMSDGSFSQHSTNYHRLFLDTVSMAAMLLPEIVAQGSPGYDLPPEVRERLARAVHWLDQMTNDAGAAPILGANDGARLLQTASSAYGDMRPHLALASRLLAGVQLRPEADQLTCWLPERADRPGPPSARPRLQIFEEGGYAILEHGQVRAFLRLPRYRFRPSHADALHLDLWHGDACVVTDAGTWSYAVTGLGGDLANTSAHATVTIDDRPQMRRLGRFLFGDWLDGSWDVVDVGETFGIVARYRDAWGASHERQVLMGPDGVRVRDRLSGARRKVELAWPLAGKDWKVTLDGAVSGAVSVRVKLPENASLGARPGVRSPAYMSAEDTLVLAAVCAGHGCEFETVFGFKSQSM